MTDRSSLLPQNLSADETSLKYMLKLAAPMVVMTISFTIMQFVDRFMISRLGTEALAAILPAGIISFIPASFALGVITSVNTLVSQSLGRGQKKQCPTYCWQAIYMGLAYFLVVITVMWPTAPFIFKTMGFEPTVVEMEVTYLRIMLYAQFLSVFFWSSSRFFMGIHRPIITMYAAMCGQVVNVTANYVLIFGKLGLPAMGIAGAAWGTFIGVAVQTMIIMTVFLGGNINSQFQSRDGLKLDFGKMTSLLKVGFPAGFGFMINVAFLGIILFGLVSKFGNEASAATSAVFSFINFTIMPIVGISIALSAAVGKSIGKNRKDMAIKQTSICLKITLVYILLTGLCFILFRNQLMAFWSSDDKVIQAGMSIFIYAAIFQIFDAVTIIYNGSLRGAGDTVWLAVVSSIGAIVILGLGGIVTVRLFPQLGPSGPWIAATANITAVALANRWRFNSKRWMQIDLFKRRPAEVPVEIEAVVE